MFRPKLFPRSLSSRITDPKPRLTLTKKNQYPKIPKPQEQAQPTNPDHTKNLKKRNRRGSTQKQKIQTFRKMVNPKITQIGFRLLKMHD